MRIFQASEVLPSALYQQTIRKGYALLFCCSILFFALNANGRYLDKSFFVLINTTAYHSLPILFLPLWDITMQSLTELGDTHITLWLIFLIAFTPWLQLKKIDSPERFFYLVLLVVVVVISTILTISLKKYYGELRPARFFPPELIHILGKRLSENSFPSGHTVTAFAAFCAILPLLLTPYRWAALLLAICIGISRIAVGAHWPLDVVSGAFIGTAAAMLGWRITLYIQSNAQTHGGFFKKIFQILIVIAIAVVVANTLFTPFYIALHLFSNPPN